MAEDLLGIYGFDSSKKYQLEELIKFQSGSCNEFEDVEEDEEMAVDYPCPFCSDGYDLVELCHHIDEEHQLHANNGVCPVCSKRVKIHMVDHITTQHKDRLYKDESYSSFSPETKTYLQSLIDGPLSTNHSPKSVPDSLLSFIYNPSPPNQTNLTLPSLSSGVGMDQDKSLFSESTKKEGKQFSPMSDTEFLEKTKKREFVQGLISSAMFDHIDNF
ncbi:unnamed protein product [Cochlearia groenlandica]